MKIELDLSPKQIKLLAEYSVLFAKFEKEGKDIPVSELKKYLGLLTTTKQVKEQYAKTVMAEIKTPFLDKFKKKYSFTCTTNGRTITLETLYNSVSKYIGIHYYNLTKDKRNGKRNLCYEVYCQMYQFKHFSLDKSVHDKLSNYAMYAMIAYIMGAFGYYTKYNSKSVKKLFDDVNKILDKAIVNQGLPPVNILIDAGDFKLP